MLALGDALESLQCAAQKLVRQELRDAASFLISYLHIPGQLLMLLATVSGNAALAAGGLKHRHLAAHLVASSAYDARHVHRELKACLQHLHCLILVALHVQQPCAEKQRILFEGGGGGGEFILVVELNGPPERMEGFKHLVLFAARRRRLFEGEMRWEHACLLR
jgi:hypothetical protein